VIQTSSLRHNRQGVDKAPFKQSFRDHWEAFQQRFPRYQQRDVPAVIDKMRGGGDSASGYIPYLCEHCLEEKRVAFSCKSRFCRSCGKVYSDQWVAHIGQTLYEGRASRHVVLTGPKALPFWCYRDRPLRADLMPCGVQRLQDALAWVKRGVLEAGDVGVLETAGRAGHWPPPLHMRMTSGGMTPDGCWREGDYVPFEMLHKKWQYHLFPMLKARVRTPEMRQTIDALWQQYPRGLGAY
jgi:transposase-like zinc-binding protein